MSERPMTTAPTRRTVRLDGTASDVEVHTSAGATGVLPTLPSTESTSRRTRPVKQAVPTPQCWRDVDDALRSGIDRLILFGPPGTGKTYAGLTLGDISGGAHRLVCTDDMTSSEVVGHFMPTADGTWRWNDGAVVRAWNGNGIRGGRVVADEIDRASGDVFALLLNMFDNPESASWQHPDTGEVHRPRAGFSVVMTSNIDRPDELPVALRDRFPVAIRIDQPHPHAVMQLPADLRPAAMALAGAEEDRRVSLRAFMTFDKLRRALGPEKALRIVFGDRADDINDALLVDAVA